MRFFNTAGPVVCERHYCIPPLERLDLEHVLMLMEQMKYFVLHAPRQTGKTSCLLALMEHLNREGQYRALYANVEAGQSARENVEDAMRAILADLGAAARDTLGDTFVLDHLPSALATAGAHGALGTLLTEWAKSDPRPVVLLLDEVDSLVGDTLISLLRQLRAGYNKRPVLFPQSIVVCGVRDVRDYRIHSAADKATITGGSAFNIKAESLRLGDLGRVDIEQLYAQHTAETGQAFEPAALAAVWELTHGQPWLVNALAYEVCTRIAAGRDRTQPITEAMMMDAKENLILRRETHLDQLADKLSEERVRRVIQPLLAGDLGPGAIPPDDIDYVRDLGLIRTEPQLTIANDIYQEVIPRQLTYSAQRTITQEASWYVKPDGHLDMPKLLAAFQEFFREHSEHWVERFDYKEAGPHLLLQAFLQRIVNGGGQVQREYGLGRRRTDLLLTWPVPASDVPQKVVIELKLVRGSVESTIAEGLPQTADYMDRCGAREGHLVLFDRTAGKPWEERIFRREGICGTHAITVWGM